MRHGLRRSRSAHNYEDSMIKKTFNLPINLSEKGSTVSGVAAVVASEAFEEEPVVLLDADNLVIPDSGGTRGMLSLQP